jgi:hypothetical protein
MAAVAWLLLSGLVAHAGELKPKEVPNSVWQVLADLPGAVVSADEYLRNHASREGGKIDMEKPAATVAENIARLRAAGQVQLYAFPEQRRSFYLISFGGNRNSEVFAVTRTGRTATLVRFAEDGGGDESLSAIDWGITYEPKRGFVLSAWEKIALHGIDKSYLLKNGNFVLTSSREEHIEVLPAK